MIVSIIKKLLSFIVDHDGIAPVKGVIPEVSENPLKTGRRSAMYHFLNSMP
ncbi:hypothetical protein GCM10007981_05860 [Thermocladium modestius]|uniref:Uncharacterized protein n=1 Tax=Thermocladium modestius TaxID=62609 RepID=A0A830GTL3_9CREN|nr:hypothetical protein GCM10007981_05860 [Thermocladium modestius]